MFFWEKKLEERLETVRKNRNRKNNIKNIYTYTRMGAGRRFEGKRKIKAKKNFWRKKSKTCEIFLCEIL